MATILVVDSASENLNTLNRLLQPFYQVRTETSGQKALTSLAIGPHPDLVLLNRQMPDFGGDEILLHLKKDRATASIPVILMTDIENPEDEALGIEMGADDYLLLPIKPPITLARIRAHLERKATREWLESEVQHRVEEAREADQANRAKSDFLAYFSHELRTPVGAMLGLTDVALHSTSIAEMQECLARLQRNGRVVAERLNDMLDFSQIESGQMVLLERAFDLRELVDEVLESLSMRADEKDLEIYCLEEPGFHPNWYGDPRRIHQVLSNLVSNGIKYTPRGKVWVELGMEGKRVRISVWDTGMGLSAEDLEHISSRFWRASSAQSLPGSGLGLNLTRAMVDRMQGEWQITSKLGEGSCFTVILPLSRAEPAPLRQVLPPAPRIQIRVSHAATRVQIESVLQSRGYPLVAGEAELVIYEVGSALPPRRPNEVRLGISKKLLGTAGGDGFLVRPFSAQRLLAKVEQLTVRAWTPVAEVPVQLKVLVVDDNLDMQHFVERFLKRSAAYEVITASDGETALQMIRGEPVGLLLVDLEMPGLDGLGVVRSLLAENLLPPTIVMSGHTESEFRMHPEAGYCRSFLMKPFSRSGLMAAVQQAIGVL